MKSTIYASSRLMMLLKIKQRIINTNRTGIDVFLARMYRIQRLKKRFDKLMPNDFRLQCQLLRDLRINEIIGNEEYYSGYEMIIRRYQGEVI